MSTKNKRCRRPSKRKKLGVTLSTITLIIFAISTTFATRSPTEESAAGALYSVLISIFLGMLIWGFVSSQTTYEESIESPKFRMLESEDSEWNSFNT